jgi:GT2 family glycosyltransferase
MVDITIVIVTYNSREDIGPCIDSIFENRFPRLEIIVVDNGSSDGTREYLKRYGEKVKVIESRINRGYAWANNRGFNISEGKYVFLLNPDTRLGKECLKYMFNFIELNNDIMILAPLILNPDGSVQSSMRRLPDFRILFLELTGLSRLFSHSPLFNRWRIPEFDYARDGEVEQPMGAALLVRRSFFSGSLLDERFTMFFNDVDLCVRVREGGGKIFYYPKASLFHLRGKSTSKVKERMIPLHAKGLIRYFQKHRRSFLERVLLCVFLPGIYFVSIFRILLIRFFNRDF